MDYTFIDLEKSTKSDLINHLKIFAGIEKSDKESKNSVINAILEYEENTQLIRPVELMPKGKQAESSAEKVAETPASDNLNDYPKVEITINAGGEFDGRDDVIVWLNGRAFQIKRDEKVLLPEPVYQLLLDAKTVIGEQQRDGSIQNRIAQNYNITFHGYVK
ncbi:MAG: hypothetical protein Q4A60_06215 [Pasteurellaceae bacterium]|nr:hypothetical protein [Pasteurellaceae bacterium]